MGDDFDYAGDKGLFDRTTWDVDIDRLLEQSREEQRHWLERERDRIDEQLEKREEIHDRIMDRLRWKIDRYADCLESLKTRGKGRRDGSREQMKN